MKLLILIHSLATGGAERNAATLANHWAAQGWPVSVVTLSEAAADFYRLHPAVQRIPLGLAADSGNALAAVLNNLRRIRALRRVLRQHQPDVALAMMPTANILLALAARGCRGLVSIGAERSYPPQLPLQAPWERLRRHCYGQLSAVVAQTGEARAWLLRHTRARNVQVIPNAVAWPLPAQEPVLPTGPVAAHGGSIVLAASRLSAEKQLHLVIEAFAALAGEHPEWRLVIVGEGSQRSRLEALVAARGLAGRVLLPGRAGNIGDWYALADLYVLSSRFEGFPNTLLEAMAHGLPAVSFDCDAGPRDIIRHGVDGLLVPPGDVAALQQALQRLMADPALRHAFSRSAVAVRERFALARIAGLWESLFLQCRKQAK